MPPEELNPVNPLESMIESTILQNEEIKSNGDETNNLLQAIIAQGAESPLEPVLVAQITNDNENTSKIVDKLSEVVDVLKEEKETPTIQRMGKFMDEMKGEKGDTGEKGEKGEKGDQWDKGDTGEQWIQGVKWDIWEKWDKWKDGKNGKNWLDWTDGKEGKDWKDGSPDTPENIVTKLEKLKGDKRLDAKAVKGIEKMQKQIDNAFLLGSNSQSYRINGSDIATNAKTLNLKAGSNITLSWVTTSDWADITISSIWGGWTVNTDLSMLWDWSVGDPLRLNLANENTYTATQYFNGTTPIFLASQSNYTNTEFEVLRFATDFGWPDTNLHLYWSDLYASGLGALRFEDTGGNIKYLNANIKAEDIQATNTIQGGTISGILSPSGFTQYQVAYGGSGGSITGNTKFTFNDSTNRLLISNAGITAQSQLHMHQSGATALDMRFTNLNTWSASTDGTTVGITTTGAFEINQKENLAINIYTLGTLRASYAASSSPRYTLFGGIEAQYNALANTSTDWLLSSNLTSATSWVPIQRAGRLRFSSQWWNGTATKTDEWTIEPVLTSWTPVTSTLAFARQYDAGGFTYHMNLSSSGNLNIGNGTTIATARLQLPAGTATANTSPLKFTSGTNLTTAEAGALEYNGTNLFFTRAGTTRENVLVAVDNATAPSTSVGVAIANFYGSSATNFLGTPNRWMSINILGTVYKVALYT